MGFEKPVGETQALRFNWQEFPWIGLWGNLSSIDRKKKPSFSEETHEPRVRWTGFHDSRELSALTTQQNVSSGGDLPCFLLLTDHSSHPKGIRDSLFWNHFEKPWRGTQISVTQILCSNVEAISEGSLKQNKDSHTSRQV